MSQKRNIAVLSNLISGGSVVYRDNLVKSLGKSVVVNYNPRSFRPTQNKIKNAFLYIKYVYFDLFIQYYEISKKINSDVNVQKVLLFQDSYIKAPYALFFLKKKTVYILHEPPREFYEPINLHAPTLKNKVFNFVFRIPIKFLDYLLTKKATIIISNSEFSKEIIKNIYNSESIVIYPGLSKLMMAKNASLKRINRCISVGSLLPYKGHEKSISYISKIKKNRPQLLIIGNGPECTKRRLFSLSEKLNVDLEIVSDASDLKLKEEYSKSKVYLNSSYCEPFGLAALEALNSGCVLVTNDSGGTKELKKFYDEYVFVSVDNPTEMTANIEKALNKKVISHKFIENFNWKGISKVIANI